MSRQSRPERPILLLTRPPEQNARFAEEIRTRFGPVKVLQAPLIRPRFLKPPLPDQAVATLAFSSETGVEGFRRTGLKAGTRAWCVGTRTAAQASAAGLTALDGGGTAHEMVRRIIAAGEPGPVLVVRGEVQAVDVAAALLAAGMVASDLVVYAQDAFPLSAEATQVLSGDRPVIAPLFSARTAAILAAEPAVSARNSGLWVVALSETVAEAARPARPDHCLVAQRPESGAVLDEIAKLMGTDRQP